MELLTLFVLIILVLVLVYISKTSTLTKRLEKLEWEVRALAKLTQSLQSAHQDVNSAAPHAQKKSTEPSQAAARQESISARSPVHEVSTTTQTPVTPTLVAEASSSMPPKASRTKEEWETLIGGKLLNRIGALALIIGIGFFLKYAFDHDWITETVRVLIGFLIGASLLIGGAHNHKKEFRIFAQGLVGAGISILYLSVYASFNFYHLVSQLVAFFLMSAVTGLTFSQAFKYNSQAVSLLAWAGGFLTPFLLSTGEANLVGLFTYVALLDVGILAILKKKDSWVALEPLTLAATYLTYLLWYQTYYIADHLLLTVLFLSIFWGLFYALDISRIIKGTTTFLEVRSAVAAFNAIFYYAAIYTVINPQHHDWMAPVTVLVGAIYFITFLAIRRRQPDSDMAFARYTLTAIVLLVLATTIQFSGFATATWWSLEALVLVWAGMRWKIRYVWLVAVGLFAFAIIKLLSTQGSLYYTPIAEFTLLLSERSLAFLVLAGTLAVGAVLFGRRDEKDTNLIQTMFHYAWCVLLLVLWSTETVDYFRQRSVDAPDDVRTSLEFTRFMTLSMIWMAYSLPLVWLGLRKNVLPILYSGLGILTLGVCLGTIRGIAFDPIENFAPLLNMRAAALGLIIGGSFVHAQLLRKNQESYEWIEDVLGALRTAIVLVILALLTSETRDFFEHRIYLLQEATPSADLSTNRTSLINLEQLALSGIWLLYSILLMMFGIWRRMRGFRIISIVLFGLTILKAFIYDLSFLDTLYRIFSFVGLGVILMAVSYLYQRYKSVILGHGNEH